MYHMNTVGVRELRHHATQLLHRVQAGEPIEITLQGRPIAVLAPLAAGDAWERLASTGDLALAERPGDPLPEPLPLGPGERPLSGIREDLRRHER